jgi:hypothetical protein
MTKLMSNQMKDIFAGMNKTDLVKAMAALPTDQENNNDQQDDPNKP